MGLIKNVFNSVSSTAKNVTGGLSGAFGGVLGQAAFKEYYVSGDMSGDILMTRAKQVLEGRTTNRNNNINIISDGSVIDVQPNQCMIIVENGKVVEACSDPGQYTYSTELAPSFFSGSGTFGQKFISVAKEIWEQTKVGGQRHNTQQIYFINMGILDCPIYWGVGNVQFKHTQQFMTNAVPYIIGVRVNGHGMARIRIERPLDFFEQYGAKYIGGENFFCISVSTLEEFLASSKSNMIHALTGAITDLGIKQDIGYEKITTSENLDKIACFVNEHMLDTDICKMGFDFYEFTVKELVIREEDLEKIQKAQQEAYEVGNATLLNYKIQSKIAEGFKGAGENGGVSGLVGMGMMTGGGMGNLGNIQQGNIVAFESVQKPIWRCSCGHSVDGNFCPVCGTRKPEPKPANEWACACGAMCVGNFCAQCGTKKPNSIKIGWTCNCGEINKGRFCANCGSAKPAESPMYICDKCGWEPDDPRNPPPFCPQCGDKFTEDDIKE